MVAGEEIQIAVVINISKGLTGAECICELDPEGVGETY